MEPPPTANTIPEPSSSLLSHLYSILSIIQPSVDLQSTNTRPSPDSSAISEPAPTVQPIFAHLHPCTSLSPSSSLSNPSTRTALLTQITDLKSSLTSFQRIWKDERQLVEAHLTQKQPTLPPNLGSGSGAGDGIAGRARATSSVTGMSLGSGSGGGRGRKNDPDAELEKRRVGVLKLMAEWCRTQTPYLRTTLALPSHSPTTPSRPPPLFPHPLTLQHPVERLQAMFQGLYDISLNQEDPDLGNAPYPDLDGSDGMAEAGDGAGGRVDVDALIIAKTVLSIDLEIGYPSWRKRGRAGVVGSATSLSRGWELVRCEATWYDHSIGDVRNLDRATRLLKATFEEYLEAVNGYQRKTIITLRKSGVSTGNAEFDSDSEDDLDLDSDAYSDNPSPELKAERLLNRFYEIAMQLRTLDIRMPAVGGQDGREGSGLGAGGEGSKEGGKNWLVEAEAMATWVENTAAKPNAMLYLSSTPSICPAFHFLPPTTQTANPVFTLQPIPEGMSVASPDLPISTASTAHEENAMDVDIFEDSPKPTVTAVEGWMLGLNERMLVGQDFFEAEMLGNDDTKEKKTLIHGGAGIGELIKPQMAIHDAAFEYKSPRPSGPTFRFTSIDGGVAGLYVDRIGLTDLGQVDAVGKAVRRSLYLNRLHRTCFAPALSVDETASPESGGEDLDLELEELMTGSLKQRRCLVSVVQKPSRLELAFAAPGHYAEACYVVAGIRYDADTSRGDVLLSIQPDTGRAEDALSRKLESLNAGPASTELDRVNGSLPRWADWLYSELSA